MDLAEARLKRKKLDLQHPASIPILQEMVALFNQHNDRKTALDVQSDLIEAAAFGGRPELLLPNFNQIRAAFDEDPSLFGQGSLLILYKWLIVTLPRFPAIPAESIWGLVTDLEMRMQKAGNNPRTVEYIKWQVAWGLDHYEEAEELLGSWRSRHRPRFGADCEACEGSNVLHFLGNKGDHARVVQEANSYFAKRLTCQEEPHRTLAEVLYSHVHQGELEKARQYHERGRKMIYNKRTFLEAYAAHMQYLALTQRAAKGLDYLERYLPWVLESHDACARFEFLQAARLLVHRLLLHHDQQTLQLRLPTSLPFHNPDQCYQAETLLKWLTRETDELARRFDERNGRSWHASLLATRDEDATRKPIP